ncbi:hypothetical protein [Burkholderia ubonensis]|uniref:hypothetical protein n=1 Tax=Burkholderia ubonensis TaxID=101571 RepID=UPI0012FA15F5|nr:hypothetical protein [Burkholderia ubonensis]
MAVTPRGDDADAGVLQRFDLRFRPLLSLSIAAGALVALIVALAWSVPQRG